MRDDVEEELVVDGPQRGAVGAPHRAVTVLVLLHVPALALAGALDGWSMSHIAMEVLAPLLALWALARFASRPLLAKGAAGIALMYISALVIHVTGGVTEAHFYFFVSFGLVALYRDWIVFFAAAAFAVAHHVVFALAGGLLFEQPYQLERPLFWAFVHIGFVAIVTAVQGIGMYQAARSVEAQAQLETEVERATERRLTALRVHDDVVQALATASYAQQLGETQASGEALDRALSSSQRLVTELLADSPIDHHVLLRPDPAAHASHV